jgi:hypothetical protein
MQDQCHVFHFHTSTATVDMMTASAHKQARRIYFWFASVLHRLKTSMSLPPVFPLGSVLTGPSTSSNLIHGFRGASTARHVSEIGAATELAASWSGHLHGLLTLVSLHLNQMQATSA